MRDAAAGKDQRPGGTREDVIPDAKGELTLQHVERLVERGVDMEGRTAEAGGDDVLDHGETAVCILATETDVDRGRECGHGRLLVTTALLRAFFPCWRGQS